MFKIHFVDILLAAYTNTEHVFTAAGDVVLSYENKTFTGAEKMISGEKISATVSPTSLEGSS